MGKYRNQLQTIGENNPAKRTEVRLKISLSKLGNLNSSKRSEVKLKISQSLKGRKLSEETKNKIRISLKGRKLSKEHKNKISLTNSIKLKGRKLSEEHKTKMKGRIPWNKNKFQSEKTKNKISSTLKGRKLSEEHKNKISLSNKGRKVSEETKNKISLSEKGKKLSNETKNKLSLINLGKKLSEKTKEKMRERKGEKGANWRGGTSFLPYSSNWNIALKSVIKKRDNYICQICMKQNKKLCIHHIDYNKLNSEPNNLITLCINCHAKTNGKREYWKEYFKNFKSKL